MNSEHVFWKHSKEHMKAQRITTLDATLNVTFKQAPQFFLKSIMPKKCCALLIIGMILCLASRQCRRIRAYRSMIATRRLIQPSIEDTEVL
jgi:hypothetical protein